MVAAVERMLRLGVNLNFIYKKALIEIACIRGYWRSLELLLNAPTINIRNTVDPLLTDVVKNLKEHITDKSDY